MLISAFCASETKPAYDLKYFKAQKKKVKRKGKAQILRKLHNTFTYQRLLAIYSSIYGYKHFDVKSDDDSLTKELICDLNSLIELDLIKIYKQSDQVFIMSRKLIINFSLDFISQITERIGMKLNELVPLDY